MDTAAPTPLPPDPALLRLGRALSITTQLYDARMARLLGAHDLTPAQFGLFNHLGRLAHGQSITDLARAVEVNQPAVTKMVQKFDRLGWLASEGSGRGRRIALSDGGRAALVQIQRSLAPDFARVFDGWSAEERAALAGGLERLAGWLNANRLD